MIQCLEHFRKYHKVVRYSTFFNDFLINVFISHDNMFIQSKPKYLMRHLLVNIMPNWVDEQLYILYIIYIFCVLVPMPWNNFLPKKNKLHHIIRCISHLDQLCSHSVIRKRLIN